MRGTGTLRVVVRPGVGLARFLKKGSSGTGSDMTRRKRRAFVNSAVCFDLVPVYCRAQARARHGGKVRCCRINLQTPLQDERPRATDQGVFRWSSSV